MSALAYVDLAGATRGPVAAGRTRPWRCARTIARRASGDRTTVNCCLRRSVELRCHVLALQRLEVRRCHTRRDIRLAETARSSQRECQGLLEGISRKHEGTEMCPTHSGSSPVVDRGRDQLAWCGEQRAASPATARPPLLRRASRPTCHRRRVVWRTSVVANVVCRHIVLPPRRFRSGQQRLMRSRSGLPRAPSDRAADEVRAGDQPCVQRRLTCSVGVSPAGVRARAP